MVTEFHKHVKDNFINYNNRKKVVMRQTIFYRRKKKLKKELYIMAN